ncbi:hypothetical protein B6S44_10795 [Bosea sp. Tri-44]|uniref:tetratricopeptide repeat protein n=1 Tax=Bosea sp. Tri-44 TaxID=1972137 RepID=UPI00100DC8CA|nr:hypothetical protein [Bosea sp. Tri-44]RXT55578.1 hypothetical protein B6S44_10795 [Bosea sp. Tri-44]
MDRFDLGLHKRTIRTASPEAQRFFDLGLNWCFGFNQEEGVKCFQRALSFDPDCVMAHWGVAYGAGPFYNLVRRDLGPQEAQAATRLASDHIQRALSLSEGSDDAERLLVEALARRVQKPHPVAADEYDRWDDDYAAAMRRVHHACPDDQDVMALLVEALITRTPRRLWDLRTGRPARGADTLEALAICERGIAMAEAAGTPPHPALLHLHIHLLEMSNEPERALRSADSLTDRLPDAGHMNHMPAHIYVLCGDYERSRLASEQAIRADDLYADYAGSRNFYVTARCHDLHLMMHACMLLGQYRPALAAANKVRAIVTEDILSLHERPKLVRACEAYVSMKMHVLVRFGRWQEILDEPFPGDPEIYRVSIPMQHYARGIAHATLKDFAEAEREQELFARSRAHIGADYRFLSNYAQDTLAVGEAMLGGELDYHKGNYERAYGQLRQAVHLDDHLNYTEPWAWMHPPRHALAALLMEQGHHAEAEAVYRDDLGLTRNIQRCAQHPDNVWALHGLVECLQHRGETRERPELEHKLAAALARTDVPITSSCACRTDVRRPCCSA